MIVEPINGNFDCHDAAVVRALVEEPHERIHGIERISEKDIFFPYPFDQTDGRQQVCGHTAFEGRIFKYGQFLFGKILSERKQKFIIEIMLRLEAIRFFEIEIFEQKRTQTVAVFIGFHPYSVQRRAQFHLSFHIFGEIEIVFEIGVVYIGVEIGISRHAHEGLALHRIAGESVMTEFGNEVLG